MVIMIRIKDDAHCTGKSESEAKALFNKALAAWLSTLQVMITMIVMMMVMMTMIVRRKVTMIVMMMSDAGSFKLVHHSCAEFRFMPHTVIPSD